MTVIQKIKNILLRAELGILVFLLCVMIVLSFAQVILRQFFSAGLLWADVFLRHLVIWSGFIGASVASVRDKHFAVDLVRKWLPLSLKYFAESIIDLFAVSVLSLLLKAAIMFFWDDLKYGSVLFNIKSIEVKSCWMTVIFPAGFILLLLHSVLQTIENAGRLFNKAKHL